MLTPESLAIAGLAVMALAELVRLRGHVSSNLRPVLFFAAYAIAVSLMGTAVILLARKAFGAAN